MAIDGLTGGVEGPQMDAPVPTDGKILPDLPGLDPDAHTFVVFSTETCPWCTRAKEFLGALHKEREDFQVAIIDANAQPQVYQQVAARTGHKTVPQIFLDGRFVGGWRELADAARRGQIDAYLDGGDWQAQRAEPAKKRWFGRGKRVKG